MAKEDKELLEFGNDEESDEEASASRWKEEEGVLHDSGHSESGSDVDDDAAEGKVLTGELLREIMTSAVKKRTVKGLQVHSLCCIFGNVSAPIAVQHNSSARSFHLCA